MPRTPMRVLLVVCQCFICEDSLINGTTIGVTRRNELTARSELRVGNIDAQGKQYMDPPTIGIEHHKVENVD